MKFTFKWHGNKPQDVGIERTSIVDAIDLLSAVNAFINTNGCRTKATILSIHTVEEKEEEEPKILFHTIPEQMKFKGRYIPVTTVS